MTSSVTSRGLLLPAGNFSLLYCFKQSTRGRPSAAGSSFLEDVCRGSCVGLVHALVIARHCPGVAVDEFERRKEGEDRGIGSESSSECTIVGPPGAQVRKDQVYSEPDEMRNSDQPINPCLPIRVRCQSRRVEQCILGASRLHARTQGVDRTVERALTNLGALIKVYHVAYPRAAVSHWREGAAVMIRRESRG